MSIYQQVLMVPVLRTRDDLQSRILDGFRSRDGTLHRARFVRRDGKDCRYHQKRGEREHHVSWEGG